MIHVMIWHQYTTERNYPELRICRIIICFQQIDSTAVKLLIVSMR